MCTLVYTPVREATHLPLSAVRSFVASTQARDAEALWKVQIAVLEHEEESKVKYGGYVNLLLQEWGFEKHSPKLASCAKAVLSELSTEWALVLRCNPKIQFDLHYGNPNDIWAYFPAYKRRFPNVALKAGTRILFCLSVPDDQTKPWPRKQVSYNLRHHLGHTLLYLRNARASNECEDADRMWKECCV